MEEWQERHDQKKESTDKERIREGGLVTRDMWFGFCKDTRSTCPAVPGFSSLVAWRAGLSDEGGVMTKRNCEEGREKHEAKLFSGLERLFDEHRKRVDTALSGIRDIMQMNVRKIDQVIERIDRHIDVRDSK